MGRSLQAYHPKQNTARATPQARPVTRLVVGETLLGCKTSRNKSPRGRHNNMQNTKLI